MRGPSWSGSGESSLPGLQTANFSLCVHMAFSLWVHGQREREKGRPVVSLLLRALIPF